MQGDYRRAVEQSLDVFNSHNVDGVAALYADEVEVYDPQYPEPLRGRGAVREDFAGVIRALPDFHVTVSGVLVRDNTIAYEIRVTGTHQGPLVTPTGTIPPTNRRVDLRMGIFAEVDSSGTATNERRYYDPTELPRQLGLGV